MAVLDFSPSPPLPIYLYVLVSGAFGGVVLSFGYDLVWRRWPSYSHASFPIICSSWHRRTFEDEGRLLRLACVPATVAIQELRSRLSALYLYNFGDMIHSGNQSSATLTPLVA